MFFSLEISQMYTVQVQPIVRAMSVSVLRPQLQAVMQCHKMT